MKKVYDFFTFFNEIDLLKIRLELLKDVVDYHIIVESNLTHSGKNKPYYFEESYSQFSNWKNKIIHVKIEQSTEGLSFNNVDRYTPTDGSWYLENQQRNAMHFAKDIVEGKSVVLIGDIDEIPYSNTIRILKSKEELAHPVSLTMLFHYYYLNCQNIGFERYWQGTVACTGEQFKNQDPQSFRDKRNNYGRFPNAGNHFSFLGGAEKVKTKIESFAHTEFNRADILSEENIKASLENGKDIFNRQGVEYEFVNPYQYPEEVRSIMFKYPHLVKDVSKATN